MLWHEIRLDELFLSFVTKSNFWAQCLAYVSFMDMLVIIIIIFVLGLIHCSYFWPGARLNQF